MKRIITLLSLILCISAYAQEEVPLITENVSIDASSATVIRSNKTPETVEISFLLPLNETVCERYETRFVVRASASHCGQDVFVRRIPSGRICIQTNRYTHQCAVWREEYREERVYRPRTCPVPERYCAQYGTATHMERDTMKIRFKNLPPLGDSESETFKIAARQKERDSKNVIYDVTPVKTLRNYKVSQKKVLFLKIDSYVVEEK